MKIFRPFIFLFFSILCLQAVAQPCEDGFSGDFPCELIDQIGMLDIDEFSTLTTENLNDIWGWTSPTTGREYAVVGLNDKTAFVDITTPNHPLYLAYIPTATEPSLWRDIKVIDNFAFIVSEAQGHGLQVFDLTRLESLLSDNIPAILSPDATYGGFGNAHNIVADFDNKFVYAVGTNTFGGGLHILDVSDPLNPGLVGGSSGGGYCHDAQVITYFGPDPDYQGREICIGFNAGLVVIYDVTVKSDIEIISIAGYENVGYVHQGWFTEDLNYMISNDETDELDFGINTRSIVWDMTDLDAPQVIEYVDLGTTSVDHNLYTHGDILYESNYTTGLRVFDMLEIGDGHLEPFGYFDVVPGSDATFFVGSWSNYPYFESGNIVATNMYGSPNIERGLHILKPRFYALSDDEIRVCNQNEASMDIIINRRLFGTVNYSVQMDDESVDAELMMSSTDGAPAENTLSFSNLGSLSPGYYPGQVTISSSSGDEILDFVVIVEGDEALSTPTLLFPIDGQSVPDQNVDFQFSDENSGYGLIQIALDETFTEIVHEETIYGQQNLVVDLPFDLSTYYWRIVKPSACGEDIVSATESFIIDESFNTSDAEVTGVKDIYPNPAVEQVTITPFSEDAELFEVYDATGRLVLTSNYAGRSNRHDLDISSLMPGVYFVKARSQDRAVKFVKQ